MVTAIARTDKAVDPVRIRHFPRVESSVSFTTSCR